MDRDDAETRARVWATLGNQPGMSAWFTVWLLSRYSGAAAPGRRKEPKDAPLRRDSNQVCVGH